MFGKVIFGKVMFGKVLFGKVRLHEITFSLQLFEIQEYLLFTNSMHCCYKKSFSTKIFRDLWLQCVHLLSPFSDVGADCHSKSFFEIRLVG